MPPGIALIVTLRGSNYRCLEQIFMVPLDRIVSVPEFSYLLGNTFQKKLATLLLKLNLIYSIFFLNICLSSLILLVSWEGDYAS